LNSFRQDSLDSTDFFLSFRLPAIARRSGEADGDEIEKAQSTFGGKDIDRFWFSPQRHTTNSFAPVEYAWRSTGQEKAGLFSMRTL
jgi:hypothetical protein